MHRRKFIVTPASFGASLAWRSAYARSSKIVWRERRDIYPHGVASGDPRASLALQGSRDVQQALHERNAEVSPHLSFVDGGGHGYAVVYAKAEELEVEFVCIPRPLEPSKSADGGPLAYRVAHRVKLWEPGTAPRLERTKSQGTLPLVV